MSSASNNQIAVVLVLGALGAWLCPRSHAQLAGASDDVLRVCADPNNLPFSNQRGEGFENELARLIAADLGKEVHYTWWPQRRGFIRNTLAAIRCDVVMGVPAGFGPVQTTEPYYRSSYVFVTRSGDRLRLRSFDDPRLRSARIGVHVIGDDYNNVPPVQALAARGLHDQIRGYPIYGAYSQPDPPRALIDAVAEGEIDVAIAWGPLAGYFAGIEPALLDVAPVAPAGDETLPMAFDIALGVRRGDVARKLALEGVLQRKRAEIRALLARYGVPMLQTSDLRAEAP
jgi:mxaJ protein